MKKLFPLILIALSLSVVFYGCKEDDAEDLAPDPNANDTIENVYTIVNNAAASYVFNGGDLSEIANPTITLKRGDTYTFRLNATGHPFLIKTEATTGSNNTFDLGVDNNGAETGAITFKVPATAPDELFYICQFHASMTGKFIIID
jgi:plastocyanin